MPRPIRKKKFSRAGRKKGGKNSRTKIREALIKEVAREVGISTETAPLKHMMEIANWFKSRGAIEHKKQNGNQKIAFYCLEQAGKLFAAAAPYVHPRLSAVMVRQDDTPKDETIEVTLKIGDRTERITNQSDGSQVTTIEHDDIDADDLAREAALSVKN